MKAMILAAGLGTRLKQYTQNIPKPMIDIYGQPLLDINMKLLKQVFITNVIANLYYLPDIIINHVKHNSLYEDFSYKIENQLSGSAGGLLSCSSFFKDEQTFVVISGDILTDIQLSDLIVKHRYLNLKHGVICTMAIKEIDISETFQYGVVCDDSHGLVQQFQEKPDPQEALSTWINTGIYIFDKKIFEYIKPNEIQDFAKDIFPRLIELGLLGTYRMIDSYWNDIGTPEKYLKAIQDIKLGKVKVC